MGANQQVIVGASGDTSSFTVDAADFDGTNDYMTRGAGLTGAADSPKGIISFFARFDGGAGTMQRIFASTTTVAGASPQFDVYRYTNQEVDFTVTRTVGGAPMFNIFTSAPLGDGTWRHFLVSWNWTTTTTRHVYVSDVEDQHLGTLIHPGTADYTAGDWSVGGRPDGGDKFNGALAEFYFAPGDFLDFSVTANRRLFISATGKPVYLGADGSVPTGAIPLVYLHLADGEAVANFATNRGSGGNFTIVSTLSTASSSPSD